MRKVCRIPGPRVRRSATVFARFWPLWAVLRPRRGELRGGRLVEQEQRAVAAARPGGRELVLADAGQRLGDRVGLLRAGREDPDLTGGLDGAERERDPGG